MDSEANGGAPANFEVGAVLAGRYQLLEGLSGSPLRKVFRAYDQEVEVEVAIWLVPLAVLGDPARARSAAQRAASVRGPHVLRLFDSAIVGLDSDAHLLLSWQLGTSASLESLLESETPGSPDQLWRLAEGIGGGFAAAHASGVAHRWFTPADVVEVAGQVKLCGVALWSDVDAAQVLPSWGANGRYLAPEVAREAKAPGTASGDGYSLAAVLVDVASGLVKLPPEAGQGWVATHLPALWTALAPLLSPNPADRPSELAPSLEAIRVALGQPAARNLASTIVAPEDDDFGVGALLCEDDDDEDATEVHISEGGLSLPGAPKIVDRAETTGPMPNPAAAQKSARGAADNLAHVPSPAKPKLRPLSSLPNAAVVRQDLGRLAPPRAKTVRGATGRRLGLGLALALAAAGAVGSLVLLLSEDRQEGAGEVPREDSDARAPAAQQPIAPSPAPIRTACPDDMVQHRSVDGPGFCIDPYESPGQGRTPQAGLPLAEASALCQAAGKRLCTAPEWERACRDRGSAKFPYGTKYASEICNVAGKTPALAGSFARCRTTLGVYDMSGNVAEWVQGGDIRGGSAVDKSRGACAGKRKRPSKQQAYSDVGFRCCAPAIDPNAPGD